MSVRLRLMRIGKTHRPHYRVCVFDSRKARGGKYIENIGHYDPMVADDLAKFTIDAERAAYWLSVGASPSETVESFLRALKVPGLESKPKRSVTNKKPRTGKKTNKKVIAAAKVRAEKGRARKTVRAKATARVEAAAAAAAEAASE